MQIYLAPKKRLIPLLTASTICLLAVILTLVFFPSYFFTALDITIVVMILVMFATWWINRRQLGSLYLMTNNAYIRYRQGVATKMIDYETYVENFMVENDPNKRQYRFWKELRHNNDNINRNFVHRLLTAHRDKVEEVFSLDYNGHELPLETFHELCRLSKESLPNKEKPIIPLNANAGENVAAPSKRQKGETPKRTFESKLTDKDIDLLVECINKLDMIETFEHEEITSKDLKGFFGLVSKPETESLVLIKNKEFFYLLKNLSTYRLITAQWQAPIYQNHLLVTSNNNGYITRQNISVSSTKATEVPPDGAQITDKYIDLIRQLHNLK